jgi:hypothetical protein
MPGMTPIRSLALALLAHASAAQSHLYTFDGDAPQDEFGSSVAFVPDADGDGRTDVLVGARGGRKGRDTRASSPALTARSLWSVSGGVDSGAFGRAAAGGDLDGDGLGDAVVGDPGALIRGVYTGRVHVFDGSSGAERYTLAGAAPPGWFMLFAVSDNGVPSTARPVKVL